MGERIVLQPISRLQKRAPKGKRWFGHHRWTTVCGKTLSVRPAGAPQRQKARNTKHHGSNQANLARVGGVDSVVIPIPCLRETREKQTNE